MNTGRETLDEAIDRVALRLSAPTGSDTFVFAVPRETAGPWEWRASLAGATLAVLVALAMFALLREREAPVRTLTATAMSLPASLASEVRMDRPGVRPLGEPGRPLRARTSRAEAAALLPLYPASPYELEQLPGPASLQIDALAVGEIVVAGLEPSH